MNNELNEIKKRIAVDVKYIMRKLNDPFIGPFLVKQFDDALMTKIKALSKSTDVSALEKFYKTDLLPIRKIAKDGGSPMDLLRASSAQLDRMIK